MPIDAPSRFERSFFQQKASPDLKGLDYLAKRTLGKWKRRKSILRPWWSIVDRAVILRENLEELSNGELNRRVNDTHLDVTHADAPDAEALALICEIARRELGLTPYPVQMLSALALIHGYLAEIDTGEGKTLSIALAAAFESWKGEPVHVVTANDYLAERDARTMQRFYLRLGISVAAVTGETPPDQRRLGYQAHITYTTAKEVAADYLRDRLQLGEWERSGERQHMRKFVNAPGSGVRLTQRGLFRALIDEADNGLIDEAVTPLLISQKIESEELQGACVAAWRIAEFLREESDYEVVRGRREVTLTADGEEKALDQDDFPDVPLWRCPQRRKQMILLALEAREFFVLGTQYIIEDGKVVIVDESTGRPMPDRSWKLGLHQIMEAKEGVEVTHPSTTIAQISFQTFFKKYRRLSGATGTAREIADEIWVTYGIPTIRIPRHLPNIATRKAPCFYLTESDKEDALLKEIIRCHEAGQPVLVGTRTVTSSERLGRKLSLREIDHVILNATRISQESGIVAKAGGRGRVTIATNMAGRGTDIELGYGVEKIGGLHVIATEPHEARRVDRQLFGRSGRQGDPGSVSRHYAMDDTLFETFLPKWVQRLMQAPADQETGRMKLPRCCHLALIYVQRRAEKLAAFRRKQVSENDRQQRMSLGFARD
ncbi:prepilin peptidase [Verrucomicrobiaceae bacterium N1E253]|uniref:Prepilin peptidase n=1 Tax=Oceaniferula marina TaxID=2748318 RepID=A0A851GDP0_9BACT|nr:prepilin peptidase [Oceaniferula marina]NWK55878.1 prepilin peptidase [Oceaniferula marina]